MPSPVPLWRPLKTDPTRYFSAAEVAKAKAYQRPKQRMALLSNLAALVVVVALVWGRFGPEFLERVDLSPWPVAVWGVFAAFTAILILPGLPVSVWSTFVHEKKWGFSTQTPKGFVLDLVKDQVLFGFIIVPLLLIPIWAFVRATDLWWLYGAAVATGITLVLGIIYPIVILPVFNKFTPLQDEDLLRRLAALADRAGVRISQYLVMDASKRTRKDNAFFVGIGKTRRVVLYDNILEFPPECIEVVVAHELGHWRRGHTLVGIALTAVQMPLLLGIIAVVMSWDAALRWAGVGVAGDPGAVPLFLLAAVGAQWLLGRTGDWVTRWLERQADVDALELTGDPAAFADTWRRMVDRNLPDLDPSWIVRTKMSHPPVVERMAFGDAWAAANPAAPA